jgi:hypothetical protein
MYEYRMLEPVKVISRRKREINGVDEPIQGTVYV